MTENSGMSKSYWPANTTEVLLDLTLGGLLRKVASEVPDRVALVEGIPERSARRRWTYEQLLFDSERVARALLGRFKEGDKIAIYAANSPEWVLLQHGMSLAGLILVPVNPAYTVNELEFVLRSSGAAGVLYAESFRGRDLHAMVADARPRLPLLREAISLSEFAKFIASGDPARVLPIVIPEQTVQIQYTSGTTGFPKGACLHHRGVLNTSRNCALRGAFQDGDVWINPMPMFHIAGNLVAELGTFALRGTFVLMPEFDTGLMLELFESEAGNATLIVPTMILSMLDHPDLPRRNVSSLRTIFSGAANVPATLVRRTQDVLNCQFSIIFGQTESNGPISVTSPNDTVEVQTETVGRPLPNVEVKIADSVTGEILPIGEVGEICVRGYQTMAGYYANREATEAALTPEGWLRTGDLGTMDRRGYLCITGRLKDMIIRGGMHLYPNEIEDILFDHPGVAQVSVVGVQDEKWGEIVAAIVMRSSSGALPTAEELFAYCRSRLAPHKAPALWFFVNEYPMTPTGKIQKNVLQDWIKTGKITATQWVRPSDTRPGDK